MLGKIIITEAGQEQINRMVESGKIKPSALDHIRAISGYFDAGEYTAEYAMVRISEILAEYPEIIPVPVIIKQ